MKTVAEFKAELDAVASKNGKGGGKADVVTLAELILSRLKELEDAANNDPIIIGLNSQIEDLTAQLNEVKAELVTSQNAALEAITMANQKTEAIKKPNTIKIDGKVATINHGVNLNGKDYSIEDLAENEKAVKELIEIGSGAITLKEGK